MASGAGGIGGGGGGGKIRTRRCHQGPVKPYQQGRPQHQGILSRVTESVKNIVPVWLQRYFSKNENECSCSTGASEVPHWLEDREDERVIYGEDNTNSDDGRITPDEPAGSNTEGQKGAPDLITDGCEPPCVCRELNSGPLEEQAMLLNH